MRAHKTHRSAVPFVIGLGLLVAGIMIFSLLTGTRMTQRYAALADAALEIKLEAALGHLYLEEGIHGDRHAGVNKALLCFERSAFYATAMLEGGAHAEDVIRPLRDAMLRREIESVLAKIESFQGIVDESWATSEADQEEMDLDPRFHALFEEVLTQADAVESALQGAMGRDLRRFWVSQGSLIALCLGLSVLVAYFFRNYERRQALSTFALIESEERYRTVAEDTPVLICRHLADGTITYANEAYCRYFDKTPAELVGSSFLTLIPQEDWEPVLAHLSSMRHESNTQSHDHRVHAHDGEVRWQRWTNRALFDEHGELVAIQSIGEDITDRKKAEDEQRRLEMQLHQAQKMEAVGQLAGGIAHDFNNLLQVILGYGEMAQEGVEAESPIRAHVDELLKAGHRARTLVGQLLAFSRRQVLDMKDVDLNEVIADLMKLLRRVIGADISLSVRSGRELGVVRADPGQLEQILVNLCVNARDAMPGGGTITIETERVSIDEDFCRTNVWAEPGRFVLLSVRDTGCGMNDATLANIFEPFFTTKSLGEGTGLGLSTVFGLVKQHRGLTHVHSEVGKGTTFKIYLPLIERVAESVGDRIEGPVEGGRETILVAEDDEMVRELTKGILERAGYAVITGTDGVDAMRILQDQASAIDLALLDVVMPNLGGRAVFERMQVDHPQVRVLFSSGYTMDAIHTNFILDEGLELIQKPFQADDLLRRVRGVLDGVTSGAG